MDENITKECNMQKAYDLKDLAERMKNIGLPVAEEAVEQAVKEMFKWLKESAVISSTPYDDMAAFIYPQLEELILKQVEKIDGQ
jgi:hypothetical protein